MMRKVIKMYDGGFDSHNPFPHDGEGGREVPGMVVIVMKKIMVIKPEVMAKVVPAMEYGLRFCCTDHWIWIQ